MRKILKLPTLIGLIILIVGLLAGIYLINSRTVFKLGAQISNNPKNVRISNITSSSFTVSWVTDDQTTGFIKWGSSQGNVTKVENEPVDQKKYTHSISLINLKANESVYFKINSEGNDWDNNGLPWQAKTLAFPVQSGPPLNISGYITDKSGVPSGDVVVYASIQGSLFSTTTSSSGVWLIPLSNYITLDSNNTLIEISVDAGDNGTSTAVIYPEGAKNTPTMVLGKTYDFRTISTTPESDLPEGEVSLPESMQTSSRFEIGETSVEQTGTVTLDSIKNGEIITTTDPEFFGTAPTDIDIEITVESEAQTANLKPNSDGRWSWSPPNSLAPGEHTVTMKWTDDNGIIRTITRKFIVQAAEGPAFESTPSATPIRTTTPTAVPTTTSTTNPTFTATPTQIATIKPTTISTAISTATPVTTISAASTPPTLPDAGVLTPTLGLFIMGIGILMSSFFVYKTADE